MNATLYSRLLRIEASKLMSYRGDFWISAVANLLSAILVHWFLWRAIFTTTGAESLGGYSFPALMTYLIGLNLIARVVRGADLQMGIATEIYDGGLSRYLLYPTRYLPFKYAQHLGSIVPEVFQMFLFAGILIAIFGIPSDSGVTWSTIVLALPTLLVGNLLYFLLSAALQFSAFWADNVWSLGVMMRFVSLLLGGGMLPLTMFPDGVTATLRYLPFVPCYEFPIRVAMGQITTFAAYAQGLALGMGWCIILGLVCAPVWRKGQLSYTGVGI